MVTVTRRQDKTPPHSLRPRQAWGCWRRKETREGRRSPLGTNVPLSWTLPIDVESLDCTTPTHCQGTEGVSSLDTGWRWESRAGKTFIFVEKNLKHLI